MQERQTDKVRRISRAQLSHRLGAMALESPWADMHPQRTLLVGVAFADQAQHLTLAPGQGLLVRGGRNHDAGWARRVLAVDGRLVQSSFATGQSRHALVTIPQLLDDGTDALGLLKR